ncbi:MAG: RHS repeat domain-containing protein, partial [Parachlamydiaceae bacterium]
MPGTNYQLWVQLGRIAVETYDPFDRVVKREIFDQGQCISRTEWAYDGAGHCTKEHALVMVNGQPIRDYRVEKCYNKRGLLKEEREMPEKKRTLYRYDEMKRLKQKIKPDGVEISYTYDALGRLKTLKSSDG